MIPVEVTQTPWRFTTWLDLVDHWQTSFAGVLALAAGLITVGVIRKQIDTAVRLEQDRVASEVDTLRKSIAVELRLHIATALVAHDDLYGLGFIPNAPITRPMVEDKSRMTTPIIYPANAGKIALLGAEAADVMIVYDLLEAARYSAVQVLFRSSLDDIAPADVVKAANSFLAACSYARGVLPRLRTGIAEHDATDQVLIGKINTALAARDAVGWARAKASSAAPPGR
jgi:hypothetical protein